MVEEKIKEAILRQFKVEEKRTIDNVTYYTIRFRPESKIGDGEFFMTLAEDEWLPEIVELADYVAE